MIFDNPYPCMFFDNMITIGGSITPFDLYSLPIYQAIYMKLSWTLPRPILYLRTSRMREAFFEAEKGSFFQKCTSIFLKKSSFILIQID